MRKTYNSKYCMSKVFVREIPSVKAGLILPSNGDTHLHLYLNNIKGTQMCIIKLSNLTF